MAKKSTPPGFDPNAMMDMFDPAKMMANFQQAMQSFSGADAAGVVSSQQRNLAALTEANQKIILGAQQVAQQQTEMMQQFIADAAAASRDLAAANPNELPAKQTEMLQRAYARAAEHVQELSATITASQQQALETLQRRWQESLKELGGAAKS